MDGQRAPSDAANQCGGPFNSKLTSPAYVVPQSDEVTLSFTHRYSLEGDYYDGGQVRISVNGGAFTPVSPDNFTANGYAPGNIVGNGILNGQRAFNGDSPGYATNGLITSSAVLGTFNQNDTIAVQFVGAWDECSGLLPAQLGHQEDAAGLRQGGQGLHVRCRGHRLQARPTGHRQLPVATE